MEWRKGEEKGKVTVVRASFLVGLVSGDIEDFALVWFVVSRVRRA
jgi:hypothetical protein